MCYSPCTWIFTHTHIHSLDESLNHWASNRWIQNFLDLQIISVINKSVLYLYTFWFLTQWNLDLSGELRKHNTDDRGKGLENWSEIQNKQVIHYYYTWTKKMNFTSFIPLFSCLRYSSSWDSTAFVRVKSILTL